MKPSREAVVAAARAAFPAVETTNVIDVLDLYGVEPHEVERERVQLAILALSAGNESKLLELVDVAKTDYRDVLAWLEQAGAPGGTKPGNEAL